MTEFFRKLLLSTFVFRFAICRKLASVNDHPNHDVLDLMFDTECECSVAPLSLWRLDFYISSPKSI
jgi:hypothetical protein